MCFYFYFLKLPSSDGSPGQRTRLVAVEGLVAVLGVGVVLVLATVVLVVHLLSVPLSVALGLLAVDPVSALGLGELVDLAADEAGEELLGEGVGDLLAWGGSQYACSCRTGERCRSK